MGEELSVPDEPEFNRIGLNWQWTGKNRGREFRCLGLTQGLKLNPVPHHAEAMLLKAKLITPEAAAKPDMRMFAARANNQLC